MKNGENRKFEYKVQKRAFKRRPNYDHLKTRLVIIECVGYILRQLLLWQLHV